jgi:hypothetical protein
LATALHIDVRNHVHHTQLLLNDNRNVNFLQNKLFFDASGALRTSAYRATAAAGHSRATGDLGHKGIGVGVHRIDSATHIANLGNAQRVLVGAGFLVELVRLRQRREDGHVEGPGLPGPLGPGGVVLVLAAGVGVHEQTEVAAVLCVPRHDALVVRDGHPHAPLADREGRSLEGLVDGVVVDQTQLSIIYKARSFV